MLPLEASTSGRPPLDGTPPGRRGVLQRLAASWLSLVSALQALVPARVRAAWPRGAAARFLRLLLFFAVGIFLSFASHMSVRRGMAASGTAPPQEVMYSRFLDLVGSGNVRAARFEDNTGRILFDLTPHSSQAAAPAAQPAGPAAADAAEVARGGGAGRAPRHFYTRHVPDPQLISTLMAAGVEFGAVRATLGAAVGRVAVTALALWIPLLPLFWVMRRFMEDKSGGRPGARKRGAKSGLETPAITFADVAGVGAAKAELIEVVACLKDARRYARLGAKLPSGVLLCGPPGTGKTLLAKAVAGEAGVPFIALAASEFVELFVGRGAARVREVFAEARRRAPCVVFIDELDAVGGRRGAGMNEERDQTLNQLLTELDGFDGRPGVLLLAATNRPEVLDAALMRPGRLSRRVNVPLPNEAGRAAIAAVHLRAVPLAGGAGAGAEAAAVIARLTGGFSGAELANVVNEAAFLAARRDGAAVEVVDLAEAVGRTRYGVSGGGGVGTPLGRTLRGWLVDAASKGGARTQPMGS